MGDALDQGCTHGIPLGFEFEIFIENSEILRCSAYLLSTEQQCRRMAKNGGLYCGWHDQPLATRGCGICKKTRMAEALILRERRQAKQARRLKRKTALLGGPKNSRTLTDNEKRQIKDQREQRAIYDSQLMEAVTMLDEHLNGSNSLLPSEFDRGLKLALDGEVQAGLDIMREAREQMNAHTLDDSVVLALLEKPRYLLEIDGAVSMATVLEVMSDFMALALKTIPSDSGRAWFIGKLREKFGK